MLSWLVYSAALCVFSIKITKNSFSVFHSFMPHNWQLFTTKLWFILHHLCIKYGFLFIDRQKKTWKYVLIKNSGLFLWSVFVWFSLCFHFVSSHYKLSCIFNFFLSLIGFHLLRFALCFHFVSSLTTSCHAFLIFFYVIFQV